MLKYSKMLLIVVAAVCLLLPGNLYAKKTKKPKPKPAPLYPVGEITFPSITVKAGLGSGSGRMNSGRTQLLITLKNLSFKTKMKTSQFNATGKVYNLPKTANFFGKYKPVKGIAIAGETTGTLVRNEKGVVLDFALTPAGGKEKPVITGFTLLPK